MTRELTRWDKLPMFSTLQEDMNRDSRFFVDKEGGFTSRLTNWRTGV